MAKTKNKTSRGKIGKQNLRKSESADWRVFGSHAALLWLLGGFWFFSAVNPSGANYFSNDDIVAVGIWLAAVLAAETLVLALARRFYPRGPNLFFAAAAANFYYLLLCLSEEFTALPAAAQFLGTGVFAWIAAVLFSAAERHVWWRRGLTAAAGALFAYGAAAQAAYQWNIVQAAGGTGKSETVLGGEAVYSNVRAVEFSRKPNVYLLSFDGLVPESVAAKYLRRPALDYAAALSKHGFRRFQNHFSDGQESRESLNKILSLDYVWYYGLTGNDRSVFGGGYGLYSGLKPSPVWEIFKANGYETHAFAYDHYMGAAKGPHVDYYWVPNGYAACASHREAVKRMFFYYCPLLVSAWRGDWFNLRGRRLLNFSGIHRDEDVKRLAEVIGKIAGGEKPAVLLSYLAVPGHAGPPYNYRNPETHARFFAGFAEGDALAAAAIDRIMNEIKNKDPGAVVYIFGDHGATFTRPVNTFEIRTAPFERRFLHVLDHFAVYGGVWGADDCRAFFADEFSPGTVTMSGVMRGIIRCLAGGADPLVNPPGNPLYLHLTWHNSVKWDENFSAYRYE